MNRDEPLAAELHSAQETLKATLEEACSTDVERVDTGELIKVEEMLSIASDAAKRAISIRRKRGQPGSALAEHRLHDTTGEQRHFIDSDGVEWMVRAVYPAEREDARHARLLGTYQQGWLAFECEQGKRRLSPIPPRWEKLDDQSLGRLCMKAELAAPRRDDRAI